VRNSPQERSSITGVVHFGDQYSVGVMWLIQGGAEIARHWRQHVKQAVSNDVCDTQYEYKIYIKVCLKLIKDISHLTE
jgi:hypothetical protein